MGRPKALLTIGQRTYLEYLSDILLAGGCSRVIVVTGAHHRAIVAAKPPGADIIFNRQWPQGMRSSLRKGLTSIGAGPVILTHVDRPGVKPSTVRTLIAQSHTRPTAEPYQTHIGGTPNPHHQSNVYTCFK